MSSDSAELCVNAFKILRLQVAQMQELYKQHVRTAELGKACKKGCVFGHFGLKVVQFFERSRSIVVLKEFEIQ